MAGSSSGWNILAWIGVLEIRQKAAEMLDTRLRAPADSSERSVLFAAINLLQKEF